MQDPTSTKIFDFLFQVAETEGLGAILAIKVTDLGMKSFFNDVGITIEQFSKFRALKNIMNNYIIMNATEEYLISKSDYAYTYTARQIGEESAIISIMEEDVIKHHTEGNLDVVVIGDVLLKESQARDIDAYLNALTWARLPYLAFLNIIENGPLRGKDLISFCVSNPDINNKCNNKKQHLFRILLQKEHGVNYNVDNPRDLYLELSRPRIFTFGDGRDGQLGHEDATPRAFPTEIEGFKDIEQISCGGGHTAFINALGEIFMFGNGDYGELGFDTETLLVPTQIPNVKNAKQVSCGGFHTAVIDHKDDFFLCGNPRRLEVDRKYNLFAWVPIANGRKVKQVSCGFQHTAFIDQYNDMFTFGYGSNGQLGHNDTKHQEYPKRNDWLRNVVQVSCGQYHTACIDILGQIYTFGEGTDGRTGHGNNQRKLIPTKIEGFSGVKQVSSVLPFQNHGVF